MISEHEAERIESWHRECFELMHLDEAAIATLLAWGIEPHAVYRLLYTKGERNACTTEQMLRILQPVDDYVVLTSPKQFSIV